MRHASILLALVVASCGGAAPRPTAATTAARAEPLPVSANQQGPMVESGPELASSSETADLPQGEPIQGVYLWCADPTGRACRLASAALGTSPKSSELPPPLLDVQDLSDDCSEPTISEVSRRLAPALAISPTGWRDQTGSMLDPSLLADMYQAAGCINDADQALPVAKISAGSIGAPRLYLVRIWDMGQSTY